MNPRDSREESLSVEASQESSIEDVPGAPTWPILPPSAPRGTPAFAVGLNWQSPATGLGIDRIVLEHDGIIVMPGEYFPESGYALDPITLGARHVDVGDVALRPVYFLGNIVTSGRNLRLTLAPPMAVVENAIVPRVVGDLVAVFPDPVAAERASRLLMRASLAASVSRVATRDSVEVRVKKPELYGRVATLLASMGGAVVSVGEHPVLMSADTGPLAARTSGTSYTGDGRRGGTGVTSGVPGPEYSNRQTEVGPGGEFKTG